MASGFKLISADDHVLEPPDLWTERLSKQKWGDRAPHVARQPGGTERWVVDGKVDAKRPVARASALSADSFTDPDTWSQTPKAAHDPAERLKAMDQDGVDAQVLYPSASGVSGEVLSMIEDPELELACVQAYNDWLLETWGSPSPRFVPQCLVPVSSIGAAVKEMERSVGKGHRGVVMPAAPWRINAAAPHLYDPVWDPVWAKATELDIPISFHSGSAPNLLHEISEGFNPAVGKGFDLVRQPTSTGMVIGRFLFSGVGERFPNTQFVFAAGGIDWMAFLLEVADHEWERICMRGDEPFEMPTKPTDIYYRQCSVTTWFETIGLRLRAIIGVNNILWASEFPLETSTWPKSVETVEKNFQGIPAGERDRILSGNTAKLYKIAV